MAVAAAVAAPVAIVVAIAVAVAVVVAVAVAVAAPAGTVGDEGRCVLRGGYGYDKSCSTCRYGRENSSYFERTAITHKNSALSPVEADHRVRLGLGLGKCNRLTIGFSVLSHLIHRGSVLIVVLALEEQGLG